MSRRWDPEMGMGCLMLLLTFSVGFTAGWLLGLVIP